MSCWESFSAISFSRSFLSNTIAGKRQNYKWIPKNWPADLPSNINEAMLYCQRINWKLLIKEDELLTAWQKNHSLITVVKGLDKKDPESVTCFKKYARSCQFCSSWTLFAETSNPQTERKQKSQAKKQTFPAIHSPRNTREGKIAAIQTWSKLDCSKRYLAKRVLMIWHFQIISSTLLLHNLAKTWFPQKSVFLSIYLTLYGVEQLLTNMPLYTLSDSIDGLAKCNGTWNRCFSKNKLLSTTQKQNLCFVKILEPSKFSLKLLGNFLWPKNFVFHRSSTREIFVPEMFKMFIVSARGAEMKCWEVSHNCKKDNRFDVLMVDNRFRSTRLKKLVLAKLATRLQLSTLRNGPHAHFSRIWGEDWG